MKNPNKMPKAGAQGKTPMMPPEGMKLDQYMSNNGENAKSFGRKITQGLDKAFPVK